MSDLIFDPSIKGSSVVTCCFLSADNILTQSNSEPQVVFQAVSSSQDPVLINKDTATVKTPPGIQ